jgi:thiamine-monophosphate kinase
MSAAGLETAFIDRLIRGFRKAPGRRTAPHESDAELLVLPVDHPANDGGEAPLLAVTTDTISEEISCGLYADPYQAGWVAAAACLSDLAAVGASPLGLLVSETLPASLPASFLDTLQKGIGDSCSTAGTYVVGGDTNIGSALSITGTAIGVVPERMAMTRRGCLPGDVLYVSGRPVRGNGFALTAFTAGSGLTGGYFPRPRIREGMLLRGSASACMDSSDGLFATLDQLGELNGVGFDLAGSWEETLDPASLRAAAERGLPPWILLAGCHGEFELVFTVRPARRTLFLERAAAAGWNPVEMGSVSERSGVMMPAAEGARLVDATRIRNLSFGMTGDIGKYLEALLREERHMKGAWHGTVFGR